VLYFHSESGSESPLFLMFFFVGDMFRDEIETLIKPILDESHFDLVEIKIKGTVRSPFFQIFVDHDHGVTIDECSRLSRDISMALDRERPDMDNYRLEVSSPGLDRPLLSERDFKKNVGREVRIVHGENEPSECVGTIESVHDGEIEFKIDQKIYMIPIRTIQSAKIHLKW
jgi:ribosome maturation factor RimP